MEEQKAIDSKGGTMRLGTYPCVLQNETLAAKLYGREKISERHRHRYEFNNSYRAEFVAKGMVLSGLSPDSTLVEIIELKGHPWFSAASFIPSSSRGRWRAIRFSAASSRPLCKTAKRLRMCRE